LSFVAFDATKESQMTNMQARNRNTKLWFNVPKALSKIVIGQEQGIMLAM